VRMLEGSGHEIWHLVRNKKGFNREFVWDFRTLLPEKLPPCHVVIHLAAHVDFGQSLEIIQYNVNTVSTIKLADYAQAHDAYFIFASMVAVHGNKYRVIDETRPIYPENHYAVSKYLSEEVIKTYVQNYSILRICGIYGLGGPEHLGINKAITDAFKKKHSPTLKGPGKAKRNYICVNDVAQWILHLVGKYENALTPGEKDKKDLNETLYLAGPEVMTIEDYLKTIVEILLPGMAIDRREGPENSDFVVKGSPAPFRQLTFKEYLNSLVS
jgi:nucleoside-diphosphate-sugar epimerase